MVHGVRRIKTNAATVMVFIHLLIFSGKRKATITPLFIAARSIWIGFLTEQLSLISQYFLGVCTL
jgi:hypothetical protein